MIRVDRGIVSQILSINTSIIPKGVNTAKNRVSQSAIDAYVNRQQKVDTIY